MNSLALEGGVMPGTMTPLGRNRMGLAVKAGAPKPDISTPEKFVAALKSAKAVMRSNPASRTMVATIIDDMFKRPEFAGINAPPSTKGEGGQALARGEGDMAIQTISQILPYKEIELVGPVPKEFGLWIDTMVAVSSQSDASRRCARVDPVSAAAGVEQGVEAERDRDGSSRRAGVGSRGSSVRLSAGPLRRREHDCETCARRGASLGGGAPVGLRGHCAIGSLCWHLAAQRREEQVQPRTDAEEHHIHV